MTGVQNRRVSQEGVGVPGGRRMAVSRVCVSVSQAGSLDYAIKRAFLEELIGALNSPAA